MTRYLTAAVTRDLHAKLTDRDWDMLQRVAALRFVRGDQLTRLCFAEDGTEAARARAARRALLRLTRLDVLARLPRPVGGVRAGSAGFVYYLGLAGQALATARGWQPQRRRRRSLTPGTLFLRHTLAIAELHTWLTEADLSRRIELLELTAEPACWRRYGGNGRQRLILKPDSYVRLGTSDYEDSYFLEVDRGTEGSRAVDGQLRQYAAYYASGQEQSERGVFPRVLWLTTSAERVRVIEDCVGRVPAVVGALFAVARFEEALAVMAGAEMKETTSLDGLHTNE
jgi:Replication-relaxation